MAPNSLRNKEAKKAVFGSNIGAGDVLAEGPGVAVGGPRGIDAAKGGNAGPLSSSMASSPGLRGDCPALANFASTSLTLVVALLTM